MEKTRPKAAAGPRQKTPASFDFFTYPTIRFFDGHPANHPFLQEMPDPVTMVTWDGWVEINPDTARTLHTEKGDILVIRAGNRSVQAPAFPYAGLPPGSLAMPIGYGHGALSGRYAGGEAGNPNELIEGQLDPAGGLIRSFSGVTIEKTGRSVVIANADGSAYQHGRRLARSLSFREYLSTKGQALPAEKAELIRRLQHKGHRVGMVGDGLNDAGALAQADVGCAFGPAMQAVRGASDLTFLSPDPGKLIDAFELSRLTTRRIRQNLFFAFLYNAVAIPVAAAGLLNPLVAVCAMFASSLMVTGSALRMSGTAQTRQTAI
jgi:soluble P-type ATPase